MLLILSYLAGYPSGLAGLDHGLLGPRVDYLGRVTFHYHWYDILESEQQKNQILGIFNGISKIWMDLERWTKQKTRKVRIESTFCDLRVDLLTFTNLNNKKCIVRTFMTAFSPIISPYGKAHHFSPSEWKFKLKIYMKSVKWGQFKVELDSHDGRVTWYTRDEIKFLMSIRSLWLVDFEQS